MHPIKPAIAAALICAQLACYGPTRHYDLKSDFGVAEKRIVKVTLVDGTELSLSAPRVVMDSLLTGWSVKEGVAVGYPLTSVQSVTGRQKSAGKTALLIGGFTAILAVGVIVLAKKGANDSLGDPGDLDDRRYGF